MSDTPCVDENLLAELVAGTLDPGELLAIHEHVDVCANCRRLLVETLRVSFPEIPDETATTIDASRADTEASPLPSRLLEPGTPLGRFSVERLVGIGGMGVVYSAHDPDLGRSVAIKVLHHDTPVAEARVLREAQALARLSHPNVITVYEVGTFEDQPFIAMELVEGDTLARWLASNPPRSIREILEVFLAAGRGLAAAHAVGLVHRDFKPENVLMGPAPDHRVRVTDFGLARRMTDAPLGAVPALTPNPSGVTTLSDRGWVAGTPRYMAPEQKAGDDADARADVYSYCVSLYEAIFREHPRVTVTGAVLPPESTEQPEVRIPTTPRTPRWLRRLIARGLRIAPKERWPSMAEPLALIERGLRGSRRRLAAATAVVLAVGIGIALALALGRTSGKVDCRRGAVARLAGIWDSARRTKIERAFRAVAKPLAATTWQGVQRTLSAYAGRWTAMRVDTCEATWVRGEQSPARLDRRMRCLDRLLEEFRALSDVLNKADAKVVSNAHVAAKRLGRVSRCAQLRHLPTPVLPPREPAAQQRYAKARFRLAEARALLTAGKYRRAMSVARPVLRVAKEIQYRPLEAEALYVIGSLQIKLGKLKLAEKDLEQAVLAANAGQHDRVAAQAQIALVYVSGYRLEKRERGRFWDRQAAASLERLGGDDELSAQHHYNRATLEYTQGNYAAGVKNGRQALAIRRRIFGREHPEVAAAAAGLSAMLRMRGDDKEAMKTAREALSIREKLLGPEHPDIASSFSAVGQMLLSGGSPREALTMLRRALKIQEKHLGRKHPYVAITLANIGGALYDLKRYDEALAVHQRALRIREKRLGPNHGAVASSLTYVGRALERLGRLDEAEARYRLALQRVEKTHGRLSPAASLPADNLGLLLLRRGRPREALRRCEQTLAIQERRLGRNHPSLAWYLNCTARAAFHLRDDDRAAAHAERALALYAKKKDRTEGEPRIQFLLARTLWRRNLERARALRLGREALRGSRSLKDAKDLTTRIEAWLKKHGRH